MKEVVAHPNVDHGRLRRNGFDGGVGIDARHHGEKARIACADYAYAAIVAGNIFEHPGDSVVGVGAFVDGFRIRVIGERAHHDEFALALVAAANVLADEDVALASELGTLRNDGPGVLIFHAVGRAIEENGQRCGDIGGFENHHVELDAVAHRNHGFSAHVIVEDMAHRWAGAIRDGLIGPLGENHAGATAGGIERKVEGGLGIRDCELGGGNWLKRDREAARVFVDELAILNVKTQRRIRLGGVRVFAGESFRLGGGRDLRGERGREGKQEEE